MPSSSARDSTQRTDGASAWGKTPYPIDEALLAAMEAGLPDCAVQCLGVDRLLMSLFELSDIGEARLFRIDVPNPPALIGAVSLFLMSGLPRLPSNPLRILHVAMELSPWATAGDVAPFIAGLALQHSIKQVTRSPWLFQEHACCPWPRSFATRSRRQWHAAPWVGRSTLRAPSASTPDRIRSNSCP